MFVFTSFFLTSCQQDISNLPKITVSKDTIIFDTVFTNLGSMTKVFLIRNNSNETVNLDKVYIPGGNASDYRFNVNGFQGPSVEDLELEAHDSMYVFVEVTIDPNGGTTPLIVEDSIVVEYNNNASYARAILVAFGQDAIYYYPTDTIFYSNGSILPYSTFPCGDVTWGPGKPIVVVGYISTETICPGHTLTILPGTKVHFYSNSALFIDDGWDLHALGDANNPIVFQGTKLEYAYKDVPGQWDRIYLFGDNTNHIIRNAVIKNGFIGLQLDDRTALTTGNSSTPKHVQLENVKIQNMSAVGILSRQFNMDAYNVLISNCGQYDAALTFGGAYRMYHCTFANYWSGSIRNFPSLFFSNYYFDGINPPFAANLNLEFNNGIVYGNTLAEVDFDSTGGVAFNYIFRHSLLRLDDDALTPAVHYANCVVNQEPEFTDDFNGVYTLKNISPALNIGDPVIVNSFADKLLFDLAGNNRLTSNNPDAGVFEK
jgi:hypothetical protein